MIAAMPAPQKYKPPFTSTAMRLVKLEKADILAVQAVAKGVASSNQQKRALEVISVKLALVNDNPYHGQAPETDFACGRKFVGDQIISIIEEPVKPEEGN